MKFGRWFAAALLVGATALSAGSAFAAGSSDAPLAANGTWTALAAGEQNWYAFNYAGDESTITVRMDAENADTVGFSVWTPENLRQWQAGEAVEPIGRGTVNDLDDGALTWTGDFNEAGTFYVVVDGSGANHYALSISGSGVVLPAAAEAAPAATATAPAASETAAAAPAATTEAPAVAAKSGASPSDALNVAKGDWANLAAGQTVWYAFSYSGDDSEVLVRMAVDSNNPASFSVWTAEQLANGDDEPVGRGSVNDALGGDLVWTGSFTQAGTYYVAVSAGATQKGYALTIQ